MGQAFHKFTNYRLIYCITLVCVLSVEWSCKAENGKVYEPQYSNKPVLNPQLYIFGVHPLHNPERLHEIFGPIIDYLSEQIPNASFQLEASRNYADFEKKLYAGHFHFALPNPYQTVVSLKHGYKVFGKMADDENFCGIILIRKDSKIEQISDLKGKSVSYPAPTALAATMMPQYFLYASGINVNKDIENQYVGSQESSIMSVYLGNTAAGATWPPPWEAFKNERPELSRDLIVKWKTAPLINNGLVVRLDVDSALTKQVATILFSLHTFAEGRNWLKRMELSSFEKADNKRFDVVNDFLKVFQENVRTID